ncbi:Zinc finger CCHC domain-containing protein 3 [Holothuria leucospilota]|uniref:Zinc finger CCHC domain-containing protein 3 n=1 Tax=Holothuria leucospilota TaxID=206669 RepID=A0A9Q1BF04_HOLLE|nr:Zinc finger CCHC domain-containing protein 3 [Holothuria leucospilota]
MSSTKVRNDSGDTQRLDAAANKSKLLKENSVRIMDIEFNARDVISAISDDIGKGNILGCVKTAGQWIVTLKNADDAELLQQTGLQIGNDMCTVMGVSRSVLTVSLFNVPTYVSDAELSDKLMEYGCRILSPWTRKYYYEFPAIENGTRFVRLELPSNAKSLPYAIVINGNHLRLKHNGQSRVCNNCLSEEHLMRSCPQYLCSSCGQQGHTESRCPSVKCFRCQRLGHKSFNCPDKIANSTEPNEGKTTEEPMKEQVGSDDHTQLNLDILEQLDSDILNGDKPNMSKPGFVEINEDEEGEPGIDTEIENKELNSEVASTSRVDGSLPVNGGSKDIDINPSQKRTASSDDDGYANLTSIRGKCKATKTTSSTNLCAARNLMPLVQSLQTKSV